MFAKFFSSFLLAVTSLLGGSVGDKVHMATTTASEPTVIEVRQNAPVAPAAANAKMQPTEEPSGATLMNVNVTAKSAVVASSVSSNNDTALSDAELLALADDKYASGNLPLGDYKYVTDAPQKGYIYLCNVRKDNPGSMVNGPWMHGSVWNINEKVAVSGTVAWPNAIFSSIVSGANRILSGNGLPINHTTGTFPVEKGTTAGAYDPNPNTISAQTLKDILPANPTYSETPYCMGGEVGVMLSGVPLFNGFDAGLRDAAAHEVQDSCEGHPQGDGEYHYHSLSSCFNDTSVSTVIGYALDGFPITGPVVSKDKYLTTEDLDVCHGITSDIIVDGNKKTSYHYVMTMDFPYSASCFRGKPTMNVPKQAGTGASAPSSVAPVSDADHDHNEPRTPPQEAISACSGKTSGTCSFTTPMGSISGNCQTVPEGIVACVPQR